MSAVALAKEQKQLVERKFPKLEAYCVQLKLTEAEKKTFNLALLANVFSKNYCEPSALAGLRQDQIASPFINVMDRDYQEAMTHYKKLLVAAELADNQTIAKYKKFRIYENYSGFAWLFRLFGCQFIYQSQYDRDTIAHRYSWLHTVSILESQRMQTLKTKLENAIVPRVKDLENLEKKKQIDVRIAKQAWQLRQVYRALFPGVVLEVGAALDRLLHEDKYDYQKM